MLTLHSYFPLQVFQLMKNKVLIFIAGLFAGLIVGVLFSVAIKELLIEFKDLRHSLNKINLKQNQLSQRLDSIQGKLVPDAKKPLPVQTASKTSIPVTTKPTETIENTQPTNEKNSSASSDAPVTQDSDVVVMTNQLISVFSVPLKNKDTSSVNKKNEKTDSTLATMSEVDENKEPLEYRIEFWKSPLNYKGYKMSRGKIILYGLNSTSPINLTLNDGSYYLLVNQSAYKVDFTDDYKPFDRVTDKATLKKIGL